MNLQEHYPQGSFIIREGAAGDTFFIISHGRVQVTATSDEDSSPSAIEPHPQKLKVKGLLLLSQQQQVDQSQSQQDAADIAPAKILRELGHGDYFGEHALLKEERRSANVIAISEVEVLTLDRESFMQLIGDLSEFNLNRKPPHSSSCSELNMLSQSPDVGSPLSRSIERYDDAMVKKQLSCSLPNPTLEISRYIKGEDFDFSKLRLDDLEFCATLGVGGFGRVELVQVNEL